MKILLCLEFYRFVGGKKTQRMSVAWARKLTRATIYRREFYHCENMFCISYILDFQQILLLSKHEKAIRISKQTIPTKIGMVGKWDDTHGRHV